MAAAKTEPVDYLTLLSYVKELDIKIYGPDQIISNFTDSELLGSGNSMNVYRGDLIEDPSLPNCERIPVAIKVPKVNLKDMNRDSKAFKVLADVRQELRMMKHFDAHPNVVSLYGVGFQDLKPFTIVELAEDCITDYLVIKKEENMPADWEIKARFCCEVADGLQALHMAKIVHGDLKGNNILLFNDYEGKLVAKIADFGYSATEATIERGGKTGGSLHFLAPECTIYAPTNMKEYENQPMKDKYAFGLFVWQVAKDGETPYEELGDDDIHKLKNSDINLDILMNDLESDTPDYFRDVIAAMTKYFPEERGDLKRVRGIMGLDDMDDDMSYTAAKNNLELYARELPRDITKADLSSIELMSIPLSLKTKICRNYEKAAANGDMDAMFMMAICYSTGFAIEKNKEKTFDWCIKAAKAGSLDAMFNIAENYEIKRLLRLQIPVERKMAFSWYIKAAEEGYYNAIKEVYYCYSRGIAVEKDDQKAEYWLDKLKVDSTLEVNMNIQESPLHRAARLGNVEAARSLLEQGIVDINTKDKYGQTAMHIAAQYGHIEVVKLLMATLGADANAKSMYGWTPLKLAAGKGHVEIVRLLSEDDPITALDLSSNLEASILAESLEMYTDLIKLDLTANNIGDEGACALAESLKQHTILLTELDLRSNNIDVGGTRALAKFLEQNSALTHLDLGSNNIGDEGVSVLAKCLEQNKTLIQLNLWSNSIGDKGACALAESLKQNSALTQLNLKRNVIGNEGACSLAECLRLNSTLNQLSLISNNIGDDGARALEGCLNQNSTLTLLNIKLNKLSRETRKYLRQNKIGILQC